jgi:hypothetical protein
MLPPSGYSALNALKLNLHFNTYCLYTAPYYIIGARGGAVGSGTELQV